MAWKGTTAESCRWSEYAIGILGDDCETTVRFWAIGVRQIIREPLRSWFAGMKSLFICNTTMVAVVDVTGGKIWQTNKYTLI